MILPGSWHQTAVIESLIFIVKENKQMESKAFLVWHDAIDGAMDVYNVVSLARGTELADARNRANDETGDSDAGHWKAYAQLPTECSIYKRHSGMIG